MDETTRRKLLKRVGTIGSVACLATGSTRAQPTGEIGAAGPADAHPFHSAAFDDDPMIAEIDSLEEFAQAGHW